MAQPVTQHANSAKGASAVRDQASPSTTATAAADAPGMPTRDRHEGVVKRWCPDSGIGIISWENHDVIYDSGYSGKLKPGLDVDFEFTPHGFGKYVQNVRGPGVTYGEDSRTLDGLLVGKVINGHSGGSGGCFAKTDEGNVFCPGYVSPGGLPEGLKVHIQTEDSQYAPRAAFIRGAGERVAILLLPDMVIDIELDTKEKKVFSVLCCVAQMAHEEAGNIDPLTVTAVETTFCPKKWHGEEGSFRIRNDSHPLYHVGMSSSLMDLLEEKLKKPFPGFLRQESFAVRMVKVNTKIPNVLQHFLKEIPNVCDELCVHHDGMWVRKVRVLLCVDHEDSPHYVVLRSLEETQFSFPGGVVDSKDKTIKATLERKLNEELGSLGLEFNLESDLDIVVQSNRTTTAYVAVKATLPNFDNPKKKPVAGVSWRLYHNNIEAAAPPEHAAAYRMTFKELINEDLKFAQELLKFKITDNALSKFGDDLRTAQEDIKDITSRKNSTPSDSPPFSP
ncbi:hypothetical protein DIPPA_06839 [Diplonema papillatum]|nr:hypothetical protein DIPPA_06839 [Diplonema papillatum]KAJ9472581.1 hypothetical protein DIPPA_06839 [Diplonema papillatum]